MAFRQSDVQNSFLCDRCEHVRQCVFPDCHERGEVLVALLCSQGKAADAAAALLLRAIHHRFHLVHRCNRRSAARSFLHNRASFQRGGLVSGQIPGDQRNRTVLAGTLSLPESAAGLCGAAGHHLSLLSAPAALHHLQKHQHVVRQKTRQSHQVCHHRGLVLFPVLAAQPGADNLGHPRQTRRG